MSKSTVAIWQRMELAELRQEQEQLAEVLKGKALEAAPLRGWDPLLFGRRKYRATVAQVAPARLSDTLTAEWRDAPQFAGDLDFDIGRVLSTRLRRQAAAKSPQV